MSSPPLTFTEFVASMSPHLRDVNDGIIEGYVRQNKALSCQACSKKTSVIEVNHIKLPEGVEPSHRLIAYKRGTVVEHLESPAHPHKFLGIGCGCYARFHRQLAHIVDVRETRQALSE